MSWLLSPEGGVATLSLVGDVLITSAVKGDIIAFDGTNWVDVTVGTNDQVLTADSAVAAGVKWAASGAPVWILKTANYTMVKGDRVNMEATSAAATLTIAATIAAGDEFIIHNQTTSTKVVDVEPNTGHTIKGPGGDVVGGTDTLVLATGETVRLVAVSTSVLEII